MGLLLLIALSWAVVALVAAVGLGVLARTGDQLEEQQASSLGAARADVG